MSRVGIGNNITQPDARCMSWVMWYHSTKHIEVFKNMQLNIVLKFLKNGAFKKAIRKESEEK